MKSLTTQQFKILTLVGTFGYLSTRDVSKLAWPNSEAHSAHVMAQASLSRLADLGLVLARDLRERPAAKRELPTPKTGIAKGYVLTKRGAEELNNHWMPEYWAHDLPADANASFWFADGYNLSLKDHVVRTPVIELCHQMTARWNWVDDTDPTERSVLTMLPVGRRGASRNFLGLKAYSHFDAVLVNNRFEFVFGVYLADPLTSTATTKVAKLAKQGTPFLIAADRPPRIPTLVKWRERTAPAIAIKVAQHLPVGLEA